jgi:hypothetical protein
LKAWDHILAAPRAAIVLFEKKHLLRIHCGVEVTELGIKKQHTLSTVLTAVKKPTVTPGARAG